MNRLQQSWVWLRRIAHCRGFGIQSPTDYRFVRYVVNEHWPYYAYAELGESDDWLRRKLGRLYFRLANYLQPDTIVDLVGMKEYLRAGCRRASISTTFNDLQASGLRAQRRQDAGGSTPQLILVPAEVNVSQLMESAGEHTALVVQNIWQHPKAWKKVLNDSRPTVTFDLYYCGIVFFTPKRTRQNYIVNF
mgnify:CR=1 FL=1